MKPLTVIARLKAKGGCEVSESRAPFVGEKA